MGAVDWIRRRQQKNKELKERWQASRTGQWTHRRTEAARTAYHERPRSRIRIWYGRKPKFHKPKKIIIEKSRPGHRKGERIVERSYVSPHEYSKKWEDHEIEERRRAFIVGDRSMPGHGGHPIRRASPKIAREIRAKYFPRKRHRLKYRLN